ncbi:unnamed protein product [Schistocephalus solidus]|uniref:RES domain-containing protein n=1 Tax=Schistocephalus solidus TaxID=70667 RepID=A0A183TK33_SCHSO|nr:unnamed protein product [Schistocephalus solidus]
MQRNRVKGLIVRTRQAFEVDLLNRATVNPKLFYGNPRQNTRNKDPIPLLRTVEGIDLTEDGVKADHLSEFFQSVFTKETSYDYPTNGFEVNTIIETVHFTETTVLKELLGLKESNSPGPDEVRLWKKSLSNGTPASQNAYKMQRNRVKGLIVRTRQAFEVDLLNRATVNPKLFYGLALSYNSHAGVFEVFTI